MMPQQPVITRCGTCRSFFWIADAAERGDTGSRLPAGDEDPIAYVRELSAQELMEAIDAGVARSTQQEIQLRIRVWHYSNDPCRAAHLPESSAHTSAEARHNLTRLMQLLDETDPQARLLKAEAARELGEFDATLALLETTVPSQYQAAADLIRRLARERTCGVSEIGRIR
jgi:hypothetical protein